MRFLTITANVLHADGTVTDEYADHTFEDAPSLEHLVGIFVVETFAQARREHGNDVALDLTVVTA